MLNISAPMPVRVCRRAKPPVESYGLLSLIPPVVAIGLALWTRQVFLSLLIGITAGYIILAGGNPFTGVLDTLGAFVAVFESNYNTQIIIFTLIIGALIALIQRSGGVEGFVNAVLAWLQRKVEEANGRGRRKRVELLAVLIGMLIFVESNISTLTVGTLFRPVTDKLSIPREKLAYIADSTCAPACILIPFNAWGAFIVVQLVGQNVADPFSTLIGAIAFNFYPILTVLLLVLVITSGRDIGPMKKAEGRARETGALLRDGAVPMMAGEITMMEAKPDTPKRALNMVIPLLAMVILMPVFLAYTGWNAEGAETLIDKISAGSGGKSVLYAVTGATLISMALNKVQGIMGVREMVDISLKGMSGMLPLAILMVLAFAIGNLCGNDQLGTGAYVAAETKSFLSPALIPALLFLISLALAAVLGGGVFGDHCSPISDTSIITSMATANDHIDHVRTQLPYALIVGGVTTALYLLLGVMGV